MYIQEVIDDYISMDHSTMTTNMLFNKGFIVLNELEAWHKGIPVMTNLNQWRAIYNAIDHSTLNGLYGLPDDSIVLSQNVNYKKYEASTIGLSVLYFKGDYLTDSTLQIMYDNNNFNSPPYVPMSIFAGTTLLQKVGYGTINYRFMPGNFFSNSNDVNELWINFDNGEGYFPVNLSNVNNFNITYSNVGEKNIIFKLITNNNDTLFSYSNIDIFSLSLRIPDYSGFIPDTGSFTLFDPSKTSTFGSITYNYYQGCDGILNKPVIITEGFDILGDVTLEYMYNKWSNTIENLTNNGYDVFIINFNTPEASINNNAATIKNFIKNINLITDGKYEGIYIGESMGGIIGRIALKELENEGYDHRFGLFVSVDSPYKGANIPIGLQDLYNFMYTSLSGPYNWFYDYILLYEFLYQIELIDLNSVYHRLNSTAAHQLLARHYTGNSIYTSFQNYLDGLGWPEKTRNVAYVNGSNNATLQQGVIFSLQNVFSYSIGKWHFNTNVRYLNTNSGGIVAEIMIKRKNNVKLYLPFSSSNGNKPWNNAPGSNINNSDSYGNMNIPHFTFVPTVSAIDIDPTIFNTGNFIYFNDFTVNNTANLIMQGNTPFDDIYANIKNDFHTNQIPTITDAIDKDEIMYTDMYLQNRTIDNNRDFEADKSIIAGNNLPELSTPMNDAYPNNKHVKNIYSGDFVIKSGTTVNFKAGQSISLEPGFETEPGSTFTAEIGDICSNNKNLNVNIPTPVIVGNSKICGENTFTVKNADNNVIEWKLTGEKTNLIAYGNEFTTPSNLPLGQYTLTCTSISQQGEATSTKLINIVCKPETYNKEQILNKQSNNEIIVYPNPSNGKFYITINSNILNGEKVILQVYDVLNRLVYSNELVYNKRLMMDISSKPDGIYYVFLNSNGKEYFNKLIKNHD